MITVVSPTAFKINQHALAIDRTCAALPVPSRGLLISPQPPTIPFQGQWVELNPQWIPRGQWTKEEYSIFMVRGLVDYIETDHCITVQWDGYALHRDKWDNGFLKWDYIGAPWPRSMNIGRVGNGGFSLRSHRWLEQAAEPLRSPPFDDPRVHGSEDCYFCTVFRHWYEGAGLKIAPLDVAIRWSLEHPIAEAPTWHAGKSFGFHGHFHSSTQGLRLPQI